MLFTILSIFYQSALPRRHIPILVLEPFGTEQHDWKSERWKVSKQNVPWYIKYTAADNNMEHP